MVRLVVELLVLLENAAEQHRAGDHQQIGSDNHHDHRDKKHHQRRDGVLDFQRDVVRASQNQHAAKPEEPVAARGPVAGAFTAHQGNGIRNPDLQQRVEKEQQEDAAEHRGGLADAGRGDLQREGDVRVHHVHQPQLGQLGERNAGGKSQGQRDGSHNQRLPEQNAPDVPLAHAEHVVKPEFLFPAADQKGMRVKQEDDREDGDDPRAKIQHGLDGASAGHTGDGPAVLQEEDDIIHGHHADAGEQIGQIQALVFPDAVQRQPWVKSGLHFRSPPVAIRVSASETFW